MTTTTTRGETTATAIESRICAVCANSSVNWYCAADAAFLCDRCDTHVHSANSLAQRHERVRVTDSGAHVSMKSLSCRSFSESSKSNPPPQVLPARKRSRTSRPHPHRPPRAPEPGGPIAPIKTEDNTSSSPDFFDTKDFLIDLPQEVPPLVTDMPTSPGSSYEYTPLESPGSVTCFSPESFHGGSSSEGSSFASYYKGKAAREDQGMCGLVVPVDEHVMAGEVPSGIDIICCDSEGNISLAGDSCFIPALEAFDDCSLCVDVGLSGAPLVSEGDRKGALASTSVEEADQFSTGPFAKYFVTKSKSKSKSDSTSSPWSPEIIKSEAREILRCCTEGERAPTLRLNYEEIIAAWSDRGEPWVLPESCNITATVLGLPRQLPVLVC